MDINVASGPVCIQFLHFKALENLNHVLFLIFLQIYTKNKFKQPIKSKEYFFCRFIVVGNIKKRYP